METNKILLLFVLGLVFIGLVSSTGQRERAITGLLSTSNDDCEWPVFGNIPIITPRDTWWPLDPYNCQENMCAGNYCIDDDSDGCYDGCYASFPK